MSNFNFENVLSVHHWTDNLFSFTTTRDPSFRFRNGEFTMIGLKVGEKPLLRLTWTESGGPPVEAPNRRGFGSVLLERSLKEDLGGAVDVSYRPEGLACAIEVPWPGRTTNT